jgi:hypothetical protein
MDLPSWDLEADIIARDRSRPGWKRRAVGMSRDEALARVPRHGQFQTSVAIGAFRAIQAHIKARGINQAQWLREAIAAYYVAQGGDPAVARIAMVPRKTRDRAARMNDDG